jgi:murein L,D-transpeptidase YcbB/YkuD
MMTTSLRAPRRLAARALLSFLLLMLIIPAAHSQTSKRKGVGFFFKKPIEDSSTPETVPTTPGPAPLPELDPKSAKLRGIVLEAIPQNRPYREILADAIVLTYRNRGFKNLWNLRQMPDFLSRSLAPQLIRHGLPEMLALEPNNLALPKRGPVNIKDLAFTIAIADAGSLVRQGFVNTEAIWPDWNKGDRPGINRNDPNAISRDLLQIASQSKFEAATAVDTMAPRNWIYRELQNAYIAALRTKVSSARLPEIPDPATGGVAKPDQPYPHAPALAEHLTNKGHLDMASADRQALESVTPELAEGIKRFQKAHGLTADGVMGAGTWKLLTANPIDTLRLRTLNLHRARLLPDDFGERYAIINLPSAELYAFDGQSHALTMRIVHGKTESAEFYTPIFRDVMGEIAFAPYWNVPPSISVKEIFPKLAEDPNYLANRQYEIVDQFKDDATVFELNPETMAKIETGELLLRQKPTSDNALGKVKFLLPNEFNIYLHDTPSKQFFAMADRAQSHGCIRLSDPPKFAQWALARQGWDAAKINASMDASAQIRQRLTPPVNIYLTYFTCFPRPSDELDGTLAITSPRDVYKMSEKDSITLKAVLP